MQISALELSKILGGTIEGDPDVRVSRPSGIEEGGEGTISFLANPKYESFVYASNASIILVDKKFSPSAPVSATLIRVDDVRASLAFLLETFGNQQASNSNGISKNADIHPSVELPETISIGHFSVVEEGAQLGENCIIHSQVYIGKNAKIGANTVLYPGVKIYADCMVGAHCILHSNVVIGSDGFGFAPQEDGSFKKIPQLGHVILEDHVEIGANTVIDRATMDATIIRQGAKLDNLIQIAHNVEIGNNTAIAAQAGIAGSTKIGRNCLIGGQAGFVGHIKIADRTRVQAQSGIDKSITEPGKAVYGSPAMPYQKFLKSFSVFRRLPELLRRLERLEKGSDQKSRNA